MEMPETNPYEAPQTKLKVTADSSPQEMTPARSADSWTYYGQVLAAVLWVVTANISGLAAYASVFSAGFVLMTLGMIVYAIRIYSRNLLIIEILLLLFTLLLFLVRFLARQLERINEGLNF
jgi:hypothetical protein